ncbi:DUF6933 domain-containing protein [Paenibacillus sp. NPDC057967]|uniref:DUF6933 domain-containing protein n=1 Tax=Paenibacillus sp. NPDC057967 TaxID=3346293 RepID=UPI0036D9F6B8
MDDVPSFFSWHVNICKINNRKYILFMNDLTRISLLIDGIRTSQLTLLKEKFLSTLKSYLESEGIKQSHIDLYLKDGSELLISRTNSRSVLGTMKEAALFSSDGPRDNIEKMQWLNTIIYKPIDYQQPIKIFKEAIQDHC